MKCSSLEEFGEILDSVFTSCFQGDVESIRDALQRVNISSSDFDVASVIEVAPVSKLRVKYSANKETDAQIKRAQ